MDDNQMLRLQLAACAMAGLIRRRTQDGYFEYTVDGQNSRIVLAQDSLAIADALMSEAETSAKAE